MNAKKQLALFLSFERSSHGYGEHYFVARARFVNEGPGPYSSDAERQWSPIERYDDGNRGLDFLTIRAQSHVNPTGNDEKRFYGFDRFNVSDCEESDVPNLAKAMHALRAKIQKLEALEGHTNDFGVYLNRVARALKIKRFYYAPIAPYQGPMSNGKAFRESEIRELSWVLQNIERAWREPLSPSKSEQSMADSTSTH